MPRFAANLSFMFQDLPFEQRFAAAAAAGFKGVEYLSPYAHEPAQIADLLQDNGLEQVLFNTAQGDWGGSERGIGALPGRQAEFRAAIEQAATYLEALGCTRVHVMAGLVREGADRAAMRATFVENLRWAADLLRPLGVTAVIEPINTRDIPGYFLNHQEEAWAIMDEVGAPNLRVQFDLYHCQIMQGDLATRIRASIGRIGHVQVAGVPGRNEPDTGEVDYAYLFALLDELGYRGWIGCEYRPKGGTVDGLGWFAKWKDFTVAEAS